MTEPAVYRRFSPSRPRLSPHEEHRRRERHVACSQSPRRYQILHALMLPLTQSIRRAAGYILADKAGDFHVSRSHVARMMGENCADRVARQQFAELHRRGLAPRDGPVWGHAYGDVPGTAARLASALQKTERLHAPFRRAPVSEIQTGGDGELSARRPARAKAIASPHLDAGAVAACGHVRTSRARDRNGSTALGPASSGSAKRFLARSNSRGGESRRDAAAFLQLGKASRGGVRSRVRTMWTRANRGARRRCRPPVRSQQSRRPDRFLRAIALPR